MIGDFEIIPFRKELIKYFIDFNIEWLKSYFEVEPYDIDILENCEEQIINKGGFIFFGKKKNKIIGTFAFIKRKENLFELSKMAEKKEERGKGYGNKILEFTISFGEKNSWKEIYLYSSTKLENSIYLYKKYGYENDEIPNISTLKDEINLASNKFFDRLKKFDIEIKSNVYLKIENQNIQIVKGKDNNRHLYCDLDLRLLNRILHKKAHWNNAEIGTHINFKRIPNKMDPDVHTCMNFFHL